MRFIYGPHTLVFEDPADYPMTMPVEKSQVLDRSADGTLHVETFGVTTKSRILTFSQMGLNDYVALLDWFDNIVQGAKEEFIFEDERGGRHTVRIVSNVYNFSEIFYQVYSGNLQLEIK